jgi:hypothetical protein
MGLVLSGHLVLEKQTNSCFNGKLHQETNTGSHAVGNLAVEYKST